MEHALTNAQKKHLRLRKSGKKVVYVTALLLMVAQSSGGIIGVHATTTGADKVVKASGDKSGSLALNIDHSALDSAVKNAKANGLTVKQEADQEKGTAFGSDEITKLEKTVTDDYDTQTKDIIKKTDDYKKALDDYNKALDDIQNAINNNTAGSPAVAVGQGLNFRKGKNANAIVDSVKFSGSGSGSLLKSKVLSENLVGLDKITSSDTTTSPQFYDIGGTTSLFGLFLDAGQSVTISYKGLKSLTLNGASILQMKVTYKNTTSARMGMLVSRDPGNQFQFGVDNGSKIFVNSPKTLQQTMEFIDSSGNTVPFQTVNNAKAQFMAGSLNYSKSSTQTGAFPPNSDGYNQHEAISFNNGSVSGKKYPQSGISKVNGLPVSGNQASGDSFGSNPAGTNETWSATGLNDYKYNGSMFDVTEWDIGTKNSWYGGVNLIPNDGEKSISVVWSTTDGNMWTDLNGQLPDLIPTPEPPVKPTLTYHYDKASAQTNNSKSVTQPDGTDLNGSLVNKEEVENWVLKNEDLPAGHEKINDYTMTDKLPDSFKLDLEQSKKLSPDYDFDFDEDTNTVTLTANKATLDALNKDLNKAYKVPAVTLQGKVTKDNSSYKNDFETVINDYTVNSNEVEIHTPDPKPAKSNENASGTTINGEGVDVNATNFYKLTWNMSSYAGIKANKEDIDKGFYFVDEAPEVVDVDLKNITFKDSKGSGVKGITAKVYPSLKDAPAEVQKVLKDNSISPKGQFVFYSADNPQEFFNNYVQTGNDIVITQPMTFKEGATGDYQNTDYQIDFGNAYEGDTVKNTIVPPKVTKKVSVDGGKTWQDLENLTDVDTLFDYKVGFTFTANGDYTKIIFKDNWESSQWTDLSKAKLLDKDNKAVAGKFTVLNASGKDVTKEFNDHVFQKDGKKEVLQVIFTSDKISDIVALASSDDSNRLVNLNMMFEDVTLKGATGAELANYLDKDGKIVTPNIGELITSSKTATGDNTKDEVTKSNVTKVIPPQLTPMINKYVYQTGVGSSVDLYAKDVKLPEYLSKIAQFTSLNVDKDEKVKAGDTVHWLITGQAGNVSLLNNIVDTLPKELSFSEQLNAKVFILKNDGKLGDEVTKDWKIETKDQTLTATPNDPTKYFFAGSSTDSRVVITLDTVVNDDIQTGTFTNIATINTKDGKSKNDKANVHTVVKVTPKEETPTNPVDKVVSGVLPTTGEGKAALGISLFGVVLLGIVAYLKRNSIVSFYKKTFHKNRK
ncbi:cell surface antigen I/II precursor [Lactococcus lactis subsp. hordniae]|nr:cell surface antigen I/II precursor [Lactococcus lactis subsp. hordniae]